MNKEEFYQQTIIAGPIEDPYAYAVSLLPSSIHAEYESAYKEYSTQLRKLVEGIKRTDNMELMQSFMSYEAAANAFHTLSSDSMFLYGAEIMEDECTHAIGDLVLICAKEMSSS